MVLTLTVFTRRFDVFSPNTKLMASIIFDFPKLKKSFYYMSEYNAEDTLKLYYNCMYYKHIKCVTVLTHIVSIFMTNNVSDTLLLILTTAIGSNNSRETIKANDMFSII